MNNARDATLSIPSAFNEAAKSSSVLVGVFGAIGG
jgi:hypothetical protein